MKMVALLRGISVGGNKRDPMLELCTLLTLALFEKVIGSPVTMLNWNTGQKFDEIVKMGLNVKVTTLAQCDGRGRH